MDLIIERRGVPAMPAPIPAPILHSDNKAGQFVPNQACLKGFLLQTTPQVPTSNGFAMSFRPVPAMAMELSPSASHGQPCMAMAIHAMAWTRSGLNAGCGAYIGITLGIVDMFVSYDILTFLKTVNR